MHCKNRTSKDGESHVQVAHPALEGGRDAPSGYCVRSRQRAARARPYAKPKVIFRAAPTLQFFAALAQAPKRRRRRMRRLRIDYYRSEHAVAVQVRRGGFYRDDVTLPGDAPKSSPLTLALTSDHRSIAAE